MSIASFNSDALPFVPAGGRPSHVHFNPTIKPEQVAMIEESLRHVFGKTTEALKSSLAWEIVKSMWIRNRERFSVTHQIHQNSMADVLHFSMAVEVAGGWFHTLHINGYLKNDFIVSNITMQPFPAAAPEEIVSFKTR